MRQNQNYINADDIIAVLNAYIDEFNVYATMLKGTETGKQALGEVVGMQRAVQAIERMAVRAIR